MKQNSLLHICVCSKLIWTLDYAFHHSIEQDHENNFWIPFTFFPKSVDPGLDENYRVNTDHFIDDGIMKISDEGKFLFKKSIIQIFIDNNLEELIVSGQTNFNPIHLNDIQPVLFDGPHFKTGDIFLSLKNLSMIILYRPSTNKIIWYKRNPGIHQHDVDILNDNQISVFNNKNYFFSFNKSNKKNNNVLIYDFDQDVIINNYEKLFNKYDVRTPSQGLSEIMEDGSIFIEESDFGRVMEINRKGNLVWEYINRDSNGELYPVLWSRPLKKINNSLSTKLRNNVCDEK